MTLPAVTALTNIVPLIITAGIVLTMSERMLQQKAVQGESLQKISKAKAGYVKRSKRTQKCGNCDFFYDGSCEIVRGEISPAGWCKLWAKRG